MRSLNALILTAGFAALSASPAFAQPRPGPGGLLSMLQEPNAAMLLRSDKVQDELKLTDDQKTELKKVADKYKDDFQKALGDMDFKKVGALMKSASDDAEKLLKTDQNKRLKQLEVQAASCAAFSKEDVVTALNLTDEQKKAIAEKREEIEKDAKDLLQNAQGDREKMLDAFKKVQTMRKDAVDKLVASMSDEQKKTWKDLTGDTFEFELVMPRRPGADR